MLLQLVLTPLAVLGGASQGHEELEGHDCAIKHQTGCTERRKETCVEALPADRVRQHIQGGGAIRLLRAVEHLGAALDQRPDRHRVEGRAGVDAV